MYDEFLLSVDEASANIVAPTSLPTLGLKERQHLQEWVPTHPQLLGGTVEIVTSEYDKWQTAEGDLVRDRLDVLGLDDEGRLVVVELKGDVAPHTIHMQAINYAAMVSRLTPRDVAELWVDSRKTTAGTLDIDSVLAELETKRLLTAQSIRAPRIVLIATKFPASVTASVVWLNERGVDITLIRFRPYVLDDGQVLVTFTRTYPVPSVEDFTIGRRSAREPDETALVDAPWDTASLERLADQANAVTLAMLDLCAAEEGQDGVAVVDIASHADVTVPQVRGQLAGLTMRLKNPKYGFAQRSWPVEVTWLAGGVASYRMSSALVAAWRKVRAQQHSSATSITPPAV